MALEISGNVEPYLDYHLRKYLSQLLSGQYAFQDVVEDLKRLALAAAGDDRAFYYIIGEGDPIVSADGRELDIDPASPEAHHPLCTEEIAAALQDRPTWRNLTVVPKEKTARR